MKGEYELSKMKYNTFTDEDVDDAIAANDVTTASISLESREGKKEMVHKHPISEFSSTLNLFKANVGIGILAMPLSFSYAGLWLGFIGTPILGGLCTYCMYLLVTSSRALRERLGCGPMNMQETIECAFANGPMGVRKYSKAVGIITQIAIVTIQIGFCCVYYEFVSQNLAQGLEAIAGISLTPLQCNLYLILPFLLVASIRYLKFITYLSIISTVTTLIGIGVIMYYCTRDLNPISSVAGVGDPQNYALFFGGVLFAFEGIGSVLLIEGDMKDSISFLGSNGLLVTVSTIVIAMYVSVGFYGYLEYGDGALGSVTLNLPNDEILAQSVKIFMAVSIYLSFSIQFHVAMDAVKKLIISESESDRSKLIKEYIFRVSCVWFCFIMATAVPFLGLLISLLGAFGGSIVAIISPVLSNLVTFWPEEGLPKMRLAKAIVILIIGILGLVFGTSTAISGIVEAFQETKNATKS